jgi:hypothetical protein
MRRGEALFIDSGAWIALALSGSHSTAPRESSGTFSRAQARGFTPPFLRSLRRSHSLTGTSHRDIALTWKDAVAQPGAVNVLPCELRDLEHAWDYFRRADLHKLSAVDATALR